MILSARYCPQGEKKMKLLGFDGHVPINHTVFNSIYGICLMSEYNIPLIRERIEDDVFFIIFPTLNVMGTFR